MSELAPYSIRLSDVREQLDDLPAAARDAVWRTLPHLAEVDGRAPWHRVYRSESPALEIHYAIDARKQQINVEMITTPAFKPRVQVFISYSHKDEKWFKELRPFMDILERRNQLTGLAGETPTVLTDKRLMAGDEWRRCLIDYIEQSRFAVLVVTQQFMTSEFITKEELPRILKRHRGGAQEIHWFSFEPAVFGDENPFAEIQAAHNPMTPPLCDRQPRKRKKVYKDFADHLLARIKQVTDART